MVYFMENPIKMDDLGVPLFLETPMHVVYGCPYQLLLIHMASENPYGCFQK